MAIDNEGNVYGMIYTSDLTTTIYSVASDGSVRWTTPIENTGKQDQGGVVIGTDGTVYASLKSQGDMPGGIVALSAGGTIKWQYEISESVSSTPVIDKDGHILSVRNVVISISLTQMVLTLLPYLMWPEQLLTAKVLMHPNGLQHKANSGVHR